MENILGKLKPGHQKIAYAPNGKASKSEISGKGPNSDTLIFQSRTPLASLLVSHCPGTASPMAMEVGAVPPGGPFTPNKVNVSDSDLLQAMAPAQGTPTKGSAQQLSSALEVFKERKKAEGVFHEMELKDVLPKALLGRKCKVFWPMDSTFYPGIIHQYDNQTGKHKIIYEDAYEEVIRLAEQRIQIQVFPGRDPILGNEPCAPVDADVAQAAPSKSKKKRKREPSGSNGGEGGAAELGPNGLPGEGEAVWGKVKGHTPWPCLVMNEEQADHVGLAPGPRESTSTTVPVQFFGTFEVGRLRAEQIDTFPLGLGRGLHKKLRAAIFTQALLQTEAYLRHRSLPPGMQVVFSPEEDTCNDETEDEAPPSIARKPSPQPLTTPGLETPIKTPLKPENGTVESVPRLPITVQCLGQLTVHSLGAVVQHKNFHTSSHIFPVGFRSTRMFYSLTDPEQRVGYVMEILSKEKDGVPTPFFRVITRDAPAFEGFDTRALWVDITQRIEKARERLGIRGGAPYFKSGPLMFGFSEPRIVLLIEALPNARQWCSNYVAWHITAPSGHPPSAEAKPTPQKAKASSEPPPENYRPVELAFRHSDRCHVCYTVEDYADNQLVQCDKCRVMVHMQCYGELEIPDGDLWLCLLCQEDAPEVAPRCCLCPVVGGALKPTSDGQWAHLACAIWIPETCVTEEHGIEKVDTIGKDRWNLRCSICKVKYGACIQCEERTCKTAFHPLCARGKGLCMEYVTSRDVPATSYQRYREQGRRASWGGRKGAEKRGRKAKSRGEPVEGERPGSRKAGNGALENGAPEEGASGNGTSKHRSGSRHRRGPVDEDEDIDADEGLRLLTWCSRHKPPEAEEVGHVTVKERHVPTGARKARAEEYVPPTNATGSARTEPFDPAARRGHRAPEAVATALSKRLFVRQVPYEVSGRRHGNRPPLPGSNPSKPFQTLDRRKAVGGPRAGLAAAGEELESAPAQETGLLGEGPKSATERYIMMKTSQPERLAFGKSAIHGWGVFAKQRHAAASFVTEYAGEVVRQTVADAREKNLYNSIVGAGTYMFRIDDQRVVDATKAGSIAHLINHACEPNCFSRVVRADGDEHIVITAKRDIFPGEEFTYDYRFNSKDEILTCNCGARSCRGTVNFYDDDEVDELGRMMAPVSEIRPWDPSKPIKEL